jgi:hypothetical protein
MSPLTTAVDHPANVLSVFLSAEESDGRLPPQILAFADQAAS